MDGMWFVSAADQIWPPPSHELKIETNSSEDELMMTLVMKLSVMIRMMTMLALVAQMMMVVKIYLIYEG